MVELLDKMTRALYVEDHDDDTYTSQALSWRIAEHKAIKVLEAMVECDSPPVRSDQPTWDATRQQLKRTLDWYYALQEGNEINGGL